MSRQCSRCDATIARGTPYFRYALALEGELDAIDQPGPAGGLDGLLAQLEAMEEDELEAQVHEEKTGVLCVACRAALRAFLQLDRRLN